MDDLAIGALVFVLVGSLLGIAYWLIGRAMRHGSERDRIVREARAQVVLDTEPGICLADQDACELLWSMPAYDRAAIDEGLSNLFEQLGPPPACDPTLEAGLGRLRDAARDEHTNTPEGD